MDEPKNKSNQVLPIVVSPPFFFMVFNPLWPFIGIKLFAAPSMAVSLLDPFTRHFNRLYFVLAVLLNTGACAAFVGNRPTAGPVEFIFKSLD